jgi:sugar phosphate isomerase/epimerase
MIAYGYPDIDLADELVVAVRLGAVVLEVLPEWGRFPDPTLVRRQASDCGLTIHSAHGCWGARTIHASRVDLGSTDPATHRQSIDDLSRCVEWLAEAGGTCLVVHPGGLSDPADRARRRSAMVRGLLELADHALASGPDLRICIENMPPGVHPGSRMADLAEVVHELGHPRLALALDTGHAHLTSGVVAETLAAGPLLATTHVHDNNGRQDSHEPPGQGTIDWPGWGVALDEIRYGGPVMLECIRALRHDQSGYRPMVLRGIARIDEAEAGEAVP